MSSETSERFGERFGERFADYLRSESVSFPQLFRWKLQLTSKFDDQIRLQSEPFQNSLCNSLGTTDTLANEGNQTLMEHTNCNPE